MRLLFTSTTHRHKLASFPSRAEGVATVMLLNAVFVVLTKSTEPKASF